MQLWTMSIAIALPLGAAILGMIAHDHYSRRRRLRRAIEVLESRPAVHDHAVAIGDVAPADVARLWHALARYYRIPEAHVRVDDDLDGLLEPWISEPDACPLFLLQEPFTFHKVLEARTWGDYIVWCATEERVAGRVLFR